MATSVLFVCMGNICRSPTAEAVFRHYVQQAGLATQITHDSAGTIEFHTGKAPDQRAQKTALRRGYDMSDLRARQVKRDDFYRFDYILAMDKDNYANLERIAPADGKAQLQLFLEYARQHKEREVPDPYYGGTSGFEHVLNLVEDAAQGLLQHIQKT